MHAACNTVHEWTAISWAISRLLFALLGTEHSPALRRSWE
jgi:hypothetical protein